MLLPQIIEQRKALFQFFDVLAHDAVLPLEVNVGEGRQHSQAKDGGQGKILRYARAREFAEPDSAKTTAQLGDRGIAARPPLSHAGERLAEKGNGRLGAVQAVGQRRSVEGSGTRLGSLSVGVASSQEQRSTKRRRNA